MMPSSPRLKLFHARPSRRPTSLIVITSIAIGLFGFLFGLSAIIFPGIRLSSRTCLTNSPPKTVRIVWDVAGNRNANGGVKRHKVMGFVGIQTGFASAGRRRALRNTWMPSDPQGLRRYWLNYCIIDAGLIWIQSIDMSLWSFIIISNLKRSEYSIFWVLIYTHMIGW